MSNLIQPRILKGFKDCLPADEIERDLLIEKLISVFRRFGFVPIDTPALEYSEVLLRKSDGETEKQVFRFEDNGGRDVSLRFDLTVPFARFIAEHNSEIYFPFKRYHIAKVWRGEKPQAGRYREFMQCDFDIVGSDSSAVDFEILNLIQKSFITIGISEIQIHISHRGVFNRFLDKLEIREKSEEILRVVDKLSKVGEMEVLSLLARITGSKKAQDILEYVSLGRKNDNLNSKDFLATIGKMEDLLDGPCEDINRLKEIYSLLSVVGIQDYFVLDPSITRGLDYYTGVVYETFLKQLPSIGSICSGGRYNNLTGLYMKETVPGVGASIGLDRLIAGLREISPTKTKSGFTDVIVFFHENSNTISRYAIANYLNTNNISTEVYTENKKMNAQYIWAESKSINWGLFIDTGLTDAEIKNIETINIKLKNLLTRTEETITLADSVFKISSMDANKKPQI